jgi:hypothetical protein
LLARACERVDQAAEDAGAPASSPASCLPQIQVVLRTCGSQLAGEGGGNNARYLTPGPASSRPRSLPRVCERCEIVGADLSAKGPSSRYTSCDYSGLFASKLPPTDPGCTQNLWEPACWRGRQQRKISAAKTGLFATKVAPTVSFRSSACSPQSSAFQISPAYSRMVRSEENQPMRAVLRTAERHHSLESCQRSSTLACAAQYESKSAQTRKRS